MRKNNKILLYVLLALLFIGLIMYAPYLLIILLFIIIGIIILIHSRKKSNKSYILNENTSYIDANGYKRDNIKHSNLTHRNIAYYDIYIKNRDKYPLPFSKYQIHHKDHNKLNNNTENLELLTKEEHEAIHKKK